MSMLIDRDVPNVIHRQGAPSSAALVGGEEQSAQGRLLNGARRVEPVEDSAKGRATGESLLAEGRHEQKSERNLPDGETEARPEVVDNGYDRKLSYEADVNRVYLEIVSKKDDEVLMRIPSESTAKYLEQITVQSNEREDAKPASQVVEIV